MSHFTRIKTQMVEKKYLVLALERLGYDCISGPVEVSGFGSQRTKAELKIGSGNPGYDIGFRRSGETYEMVADWWGIRSIGREKLLRQVTQQYAYHATRAELEAQGFALVEEIVEEDERIHLVLRRVA